jgi:diamine N-acetyltransferase
VADRAYLRIRRAAWDDAARLSAFAARVFDETFGPVNHPDDMAAYLAEAFTVERQRAEIEDDAGIVLLAEIAHDTDGLVPTDHPPDGGRGTLAAYSHVAPSDVPVDVGGPDPIELKRFYVDGAWQGRGVARTLMQATIEAAVARGARTMWLGVWERNPRAIAFYRKHGFVEVGAHEFVLGRDRQTDLLMSRAIK